MNYRLYLKCQRCGKQSISKDYDKSKEEMKLLIKACYWALRKPQYLICPQCSGLLSITPIVEKIN